MLCPCQSLCQELYACDDLWFPNNLLGNTCHWFSHFTEEDAKASSITCLRMPANKGDLGTNPVPPYMPVILRKLSLPVTLTFYVSWRDSSSSAPICVCDKLLEPFKKKTAASISWPRMGHWVLSKYFFDLPAVPTLGRWLTLSISGSLFVKWRPETTFSLYCFALLSFFK